MCKDVWTNETWLDRRILTLVVCFKLILQKLMFRSWFFFCRVKRVAFARNDSWSWKLSKAMKLNCGRRIVPGVWYSFLLLNRVVLLPFMVFGLLTVFPQGWRLSKSFECRLFFRVFPFLGMSEEVLLDGVNVMCKDVWTNETWLDCCILTLLLLLNIVLCSGC